MCVHHDYPGGDDEDNGDGVDDDEGDYMELPFNSGALVSRDEPALLLNHSSSHGIANLKYIFIDIFISDLASYLSLLGLAAGARPLNWYLENTVLVSDRNVSADPLFSLA